MSQRNVLIRTSRTNGDKKITLTIYGNFEANILTSKYRFHRFWNFNFSLILIKVGLETAQICISSAKGDRLGLNFESILGWWRHHV